MLAAIETTGDTCGVALFDGNALRVEMHAEVPRGHDRLLATLFQQALDAAGLEAQAIKRFAVSIGPGSYTGIRIGVAFAIGAALATGADLIAVPTLDSIAHNVSALGQTAGRPRVLALVPAGREGVYAALYDLRPEFLRLTELRAMPVHTVASLVDENVRVAGPGVRLLDGAVAESVVPGSERLSARAVGRYGLRLFYNGVTTDPAEIRPLYIGEFTPKLAAR